MRSGIIFLIILVGMSVQAQNDDISGSELELIEAFLESTEEDSEFELIDIFDQLNYYLSTPLNLNNADEEELYESRVLRPEQIAELLDHRSKYGKLISLHELQTMQSFDLKTITTIRPFVTVGDGLENFNVPIGKMIVGGKNELILRWERFLQKKRGFQKTEAGEAGGYLGDANRFVVRYRHQYENKLSFGISGEKDAGEEFFKGSNKQGFDFYSAHFFLNKYSKRIKYLALGDYYLKLGQGLTLYNGYASGKSSFVTDIKRGGYTLAPFRSVSESLFFRGAAATFVISDKLEFTPFFSRKKRDGNELTSTDVADSLDASGFSSILISGSHRTENEIEDEGTFTETLYGGRIQGHFGKFKLGINGIKIGFDKSLNLTSRVDNKFDFNGNSLTTFSADYAGSLRNAHFFGEVARSNSGGIAMTHGVLLGLSQYAQASLLYRKFDVDYHSLYADPFADSSSPDNEEGLYIGFRMRPHKKIFIESYADLWSYPWLRFSTDAPSNGQEFFVRIRYYQKRKTELYVQFRRKTREQNDSRAEGTLNVIAPHHRTQYRLHFSHKITPSLTWRNRFELVNFSVAGGHSSNGYLLYQDFIYKPLSWHVSFTTRFAIFDSDDFDSRIYAYENDLLYSFSIPPYFDRGSRFYLNVRYKPFGSWSLEGRYELTYLSNQNDFGSGNERVLGNVRSRVKAQIKYSF